MHCLFLLFRTSLLGIFMQGLLFNNLNCRRIGTLIPNNRGNLFFFTRSILFVDDDLIYLFRCIMLFNFLDTLLASNDRIVLRWLGLRDVYFTIFFRRCILGHRLLRRDCSFFKWLSDFDFEILGIKSIKHCLVLHKLNLEVLVSFIMISDQVVYCLKERGQRLAVVLFLKKKLFLGEDLQQVHHAIGSLPA